MSSMIVIPKRPDGVQEYDGPFIHFEEFSKAEIIEFFKLRPGAIKLMHDSFPEWFDEFVGEFGQESADEILALA